MNVTRKICSVVLPALTLLVIVGCVSKQEYLVKVEESERSIHDLETLKGEYGMFKAEMEDLEKLVDLLDRPDSGDPSLQRRTEFHYGGAYA